MGISAGKHTITDSRRVPGLQEIPKRKGVKCVKITGITEHSTREEEVFCRAILDAFSRKSVD
jgi:hypothetical protein